MTRSWTEFLGDNALVLAVLAFAVVFAALEPAFLSIDNLFGIVRREVLVGIMAVCMTFVIMSGGIDLSVGPVMAIAGLVAFFVLDGGHGLVLALAAGLGVGILIGTVNGAIIAFAGLPPIIVTLAALSIVRGSALLLGGPDLHSIRDQAAYTFIGTGKLLGLAFPVWILIGVAGAMIFVQRMTPLGMAVAAIGENARAAHLTGLPVRRIRMLLYAISGLGAALAGIVLSSQVHTASATYGEFGTELDVIAAVVLGGANLNGGAGSVARTLLGVLFLGVLNNGMSILNMPIDQQLIAKGAIIAIALAFAQRT